MRPWLKLAGGLPDSGQSLLPQALLPPSHLMANWLSNSMKPKTPGKVAVLTQRPRAACTLVTKHPKAHNCVPPCSAVSLPLSCRPAHYASDLSGCQWRKTSTSLFPHVSAPPGDAGAHLLIAKVKLGFKGLVLKYQPGREAE